MFYVSEEKKKLFFMETKKRGHTDSRHSTTVSYNSSLLATQHTFHANPVNRMFSENMSNPCTQFKQKITSKVRCRNIAMNKTKSNQCRLIELAQQMFIHLICSVLFFYCYSFFHVRHVYETMPFTHFQSHFSFLRHNIVCVCRLFWNLSTNYIGKKTHFLRIISTMSDSPSQ